ncbi:MAG: hypothetical protein JSV65_13785 [Armatimonadota bacterium]|nr:MAG: hypothetical protein JSV65_13785 [Armatimonadota bacterium]
MRRLWNGLVARMSTRRALETKRLVADCLAVLWSVWLAGYVLWLAVPSFADGRELQKGAEQLGIPSVIRVLYTLYAVCYLWFGGWMALDAYSRGFGDSDVFSIRRFLWLAGVLCLWPLVPLIYWLAVKRRAVAAELKPGSGMSQPIAAGA